ncbi:diguanylate cyclase [Pseudomonadota bacterium]
MRKSATILIVDDLPDNIRIMGEILSPTYHVLVATNGRDAITITEEKQPDLILLDIIMPGMSGFEVCKILRENALSKDIPIIFVTAIDQLKDEEMALEMGAIDYLTKPVHPHITRLRIKNQLELKQYRDYLAEQTYIDGLTGIANRLCFDKTMEQEWLRSRRNNTPLSVLLIDIDFFKQYNDHYGHVEGDSCLRQVAQCLQERIIRSTDLLARYGGEEFACILPATDAQGAANVGDQLLLAISHAQIPHSLSIVAKHITISIGAATMTPSCHVEGRELIRIADNHLYKAKALGRNQLVSAKESDEECSDIAVSKIS